jgi:hypothetical protein
MQAAQGVHGEAKIAAAVGTPNELASDYGAVLKGEDAAIRRNWPGEEPI